ncbi:TIGR03982 family His-Xaa-Ser system protein [Vibrio fluvialis]|nr:TIGR03982 family His-Xaa-Ser system protein [Vibrio fluvialis]MBY7873769.1 TIGR03982 family His-Xaa-Ser system protein [Vibrio fluvialis]MBY7881162.1 TIGR03982 family His-Xaa-Ser system protein [Vibrio fluvialis]MBY7956204.1 TIGR03982 family His-Xaa-Ser system protein [Vibrio fluvialis]MBY8219651.1 TIGR03982 family His-Xaa-Ser system protein [Vibrio fluvialis]
MRRLFYVIVSLSCLVWISIYVASPVTAYFVYKNQFMQQTAECALAMDEAWYIEQANKPELDTTTKVHLMACHEYDKTRKIMLSLKVPESVLEYLGLEAIELHQRTIDALTEQHRFRER